MNFMNKFNFSLSKTRCIIILIVVAGFGIVFASIDFTQETIRKTETINPGYAWATTAIKPNGDPIKAGDRLTITATATTGQFDAYLIVQPNSGMNGILPFADFQAMILNFGVNTTKNCSGVTFEFTAQKDRDIPILLVHNKNNTNVSITVVVSAPGTGFSIDKLKSNIGVVIGMMIIVGCIGWLASHYSVQGSEKSMDERIKEGLGKSSSPSYSDQPKPKSKARYEWKTDRFGNLKGIDKN